MSAALNEAKCPNCGSVRRRLDWGFFGMAGIAVGVFGWGLVLNYAVPSIKRRFKPVATQVGKLDSATGTMSVNGPGHGKVELPAVRAAETAGFDIYSTA